MYIKVVLRSGKEVELTLDEFDEIREGFNFFSKDNFPFTTSFPERDDTGCIILTLDELAVTYGEAPNAR